MSKSYYISSQVGLDFDSGSLVITLVPNGRDEHSYASRTLKSRSARDLAHWILANVPEEPQRDREADMRKLADVVLSHMANFYAYDISFALKNVGYAGVGGVQVAILNILEIEPQSSSEGESYSPEQLNYAEGLLYDFIPWIRDRALGIGGD